MIAIQLNDKEINLTKEYAQAKNMTIFALVRDAVIERIEDEMMIKLDLE